MQKLKAEKSSEAQDRKRKYKLSSKEMALLEMEKKRKIDEKLTQKKSVAKNAGVPENFFDSAKTKAFLNLGKAPQKSILKNKGVPAQGSGQAQPSAVPAANSKAKGTEWTSSAPVLTTAAADKEKSPKAKTLLRTPSGGTINHLEEELGEGEAGAAPAKEANNQPQEDRGDLPEGFFDDPVMDAKARGVEYKVSMSMNRLHFFMCIAYKTTNKTTQNRMWTEFY